jgi:hypothetical protein
VPLHRPLYPFRQVKYSHQLVSFACLFREEQFCAVNKTKHLFMKQFLLFALLLLSGTLFAQMPKAINYQAIARNAQGQPLASQTIRVRLSILNQTAGNAVVYSEVRQLTTSAQGLFTLQIGSSGAVSTTGDFTAVNWVNNTSSKEVLKLEIDPNADGNFTDLGTQPLSTVPYAFASDIAINALNIGGHYVDTNTPSTDDVLRWNGSSWVATPKSYFAPQIIKYDAPANFVSAGNLAFAWAAQPVQVTIAAGQRITASLTGALGITSGTATGVGIGVCYQGAAGNMVHTNASNYPTLSISSRSVYTVSGTVSGLPAGTYNVGFCARNTSSVALNNNDGFNGFIMISY